MLFAPYFVVIVEDGVEPLGDGYVQDHIAVVQLAEDDTVIGEYVLILYHYLARLRGCTRWQYLV